MRECLCYMSNNGKSVGYPFNAVFYLELKMGCYQWRVEIVCCLWEVERFAVERNITVMLLSGYSL